MKILFFSASLFVLLGCGTKKTSGEKTEQTIEMSTDKTGIAHLGKAPAESRPFTINGAVIKGNTLVVDVSYSGGCQEHFFELIGSEAIAKSLPPQRSIRLIHSGEPDICEAMIAKTLEFDIKALAYKQEAGSEIILKLEGWNTDLRYTYK